MDLISLSLKDKGTFMQMTLFENEKNIPLPPEPVQPVLPEPVVFRDPNQMEFPMGNEHGKVLN